jgi:predicted ATPase
VVTRGTPNWSWCPLCGIGKSAVVNALHEAIVPPRGLFAFGSSTNTSAISRMPPWRKAFHGLIRQLLVKRDENWPWRAAM